MRFAAKMTALITMLLAVSLAVGGYLVMSSSFDARLKGQVRDAQEGVRLLGMTVQALCAREQGQDTASSGAIERALEAIPQDRSYCLHAADGTVLSESADFPQEAVQNGRAGVIVSRVQNTTSGSRLITTSLLTLYGGTYSLTCLNDITDMLREARRNAALSMDPCRCAWGCGRGNGSSVCLYDAAPPPHLAHGAAACGRADGQARHGPHR